MKKYLLLLLASFVLFSCSSAYDDSDLTKRLSSVEETLADHEKRISAIESILADYSKVTDKITALEKQDTEFSTLIEEIKKEYDELSKKTEDTSSLPTDDVVQLKVDMESFSTKLTAVETTLENYNQLTALIEKVSSLESLYNGVETNYSQLSTMLTTYTQNYTQSIESLTAELANKLTSSDLASINQTIASHTTAISTLNTTVNEIKAMLESDEGEYEATYAPNWITLWKNKQPAYSYKLTKSGVEYTSYTWRSGSQIYGYRDNNQLDYIFSVRTLGANSDTYYCPSTRKYTTFSNQGNYYTIGSESATYSYYPTQDTKVMTFISTYITENSAGE